MNVELEERDRALLAGEAGDGAALAMRLVVRMAEILRAPRLLDITGAHVDSCLYHGEAGLDFDHVVAQANAARPYLVLISGDALNERGNEELVAMYAPLTARVAKLAVVGNWENWARVRRKVLRRAYDAAGVTFLDNDATALDALGLQALGLDERTNGWPDWDLVAQAPTDKATLLLHHSPNAFDRMLGTNFGACAVRALASGETGKMVALQAGTITTVPLGEACANIKTVPVDGQMVRSARDIGISFASPKEVVR